jgi:hypothetical protein
LVAVDVLAVASSTAERANLGRLHTCLSVNTTKQQVTLAS